MSKKTYSLTIFVERNSLTFSGDSFEKPVKMTFDKALFSDLEIIDKKLFIEKVLMQLNDSKSSNDFILVFSDDICFFKEFSINSTKEQIDQEEKEFLQLMPFEKVAYKLIKFTNSYRFVGVNENICTILANALVSKGYKLAMALPEVVVPNFNLESSIPDSLKVYNLFQGKNSEKLEQSKINSSPKKSYLALLIGVFIFLLVILALLIFL